MIGLKKLVIPRKEDRFVHNDRQLENIYACVNVFLFNRLDLGKSVQKRVANAIFMCKNGLK